MARMSSEGSWQKTSGLAPGTSRDPLTMSASCLPTESDFEVAKAGSRSGSRRVTSFIAAVEQSEYCRVDEGMNMRRRRRWYEYSLLVVMVVSITKQANKEAGRLLPWEDSR